MYNIYMKFSEIEMCEMNRQIIKLHKKDELDVDLDDKLRQIRLDAFSILVPFWLLLFWWKLERHLRLRVWEHFLP